MKNTHIVMLLVSVILFACGGSGGDATESEGNTDLPKNSIATSLSNSSWEKECSSYNKLALNGSNTAWNVKTTLSIDSSLKAKYKTMYFRPTDTTCDSMIFDTIDISNLEIKGKTISEESIEAYRLNETFTYNSEDDLPPNYTLIYLNSERLYFGQSSGENLGESEDKRHSSIVLDDYFIQIIK